MPRLDPTLPGSRLGLGLIRFFFVFSPIVKIQMTYHVLDPATRFSYSQRSILAATLPPAFTVEDTTLRDRQRFAPGHTAL